MRRLALIVSVCLLGLALAAGSNDALPAAGRDAANSAQANQNWEERFRAIPSGENMREYMKRLSARPHHLGSPYDKANAEWILSKFKEWGLDAHIETFDVLFPTPRERAVELVAPTRFVAKLQEPAEIGRAHV